MVARKETLTRNVLDDIIYSDFTDNLTPHPVSGLLVRKTNDSSVAQALKNLILTDAGERLFQPYIGGNVRASLFEPLDNFAARDLEHAIMMTARNGEPRAEILNVYVVVNHSVDGYDITVEFRVHNKKDVQRFDLVLTRVR